METKGKITPEEILMNTKTRAESDLEFVRGGAEAEFDPATNRVVISPTDEQIERARDESPDTVAKLRRIEALSHIETILNDQRYDYQCPRFASDLKRDLREIDKINSFETRLEGAKREISDYIDQLILEVEKAKQEFKGFNNSDSIEHRSQVLNEIADRTKISLSTKYFRKRTAAETEEMLKFNEETLISKLDRKLATLTQAQEELDSLQ